MTTLAVPILDDLERRPPAARRLAVHAALPAALDAPLLRHLRDAFLLDGPPELCLPVTPASESAMARLLLSSLFTPVDDGLYEMDRTARAVLLAELAAIDGGRRLAEVAALLEQYTLVCPSWSDELRWAQRISARVTHDPQAVADWLTAGADHGGGVGLPGRWFAAMRSRVEADRATAASLVERDAATTRPGAEPWPAGVEAFLAATLPRSQRQPTVIASIATEVRRRIHPGERLVFVARSEPGRRNGSATVIVTDLRFVVACRRGSLRHPMPNADESLGDIVDCTLRRRYAYSGKVDLEVVLATDTVVVRDLLREAGEGLHRVLSAAVAVSLPPELATFVAEFDAMRELPDVRDRVARRGRVVAELRALLAAGDPLPPPLVARLWRSGLPGERMVGVVCLQEVPDVGYLSRLAVRARPGEDLDHIAYESAVALRDAAEYLPVSDLEEVAAAVDFAVRGCADVPRAHRTAVLRRAAEVLERRRAAPARDLTIRVPWRTWTDRSVLRIRFLGGARVEHERIALLARKWTVGTGVAFDFLASGSSAPAEIRVAVDADEGPSSVLGTEALDVPEPEPTAHLPNAWSPADVLRVFGHVLGLVPEHQQPHADLAWNVEAVMRRYTGAPRHLTREQVERSVLARYEFPEPPLYRSFTPDTVMLPVFDRGLFTTDPGDRLGATLLTDADRAFVARLYPPDADDAVRNHAADLLEDFRRVGDPGVLDAAIGALGELSDRSAETPWLLGVARRERFAMTGDLADLDAAIGALQLAVRRAAEVGSGAAMRDLAAALRDRFTSTGDPDALRTAADLFASLRRYATSAEERAGATGDEVVTRVVLAELTGDPGERAAAVALYRSDLVWFLDHAEVVKGVEGTVTESDLRAALEVARVLSRDPTPGEHVENDVVTLERLLDVPDHHVLGERAFSAGDLDEAERHFREAVAQTDPTRATFRDDAERRRAAVLGERRLGEIALVRGRTAGAGRHFERARDVVEESITLTPDEDWLQRDLAALESRLGEVALAEGDRDAARWRFSAGLATTAHLATVDPTDRDLQRDLVIGHGRLGDVARLDGRLEDAAEYHRYALTVAEQLVGADPTNPVFRFDLATAHRHLALVATELGDPAIAARHLDAATGLVDELLTTDPNNKAYRLEAAFLRARRDEGSPPGASS